MIFGGEPGIERGDWMCRQSFNRHLWNYPRCFRKPYGFYKTRNFTARAKAHAECPLGVAVCNVKANDTYAVFAVESHDVPASVNSHWSKTHLTRLRYCRLNKGFSVCKFSFAIICGCQIVRQQLAGTLAG